MKIFKNKLATGLVLCSLMAGMPGGAIAGADIVTLCKSFSTLDPVAFEENFGNIGQCASLFRTLPVESCQMLNEEGRLDDFGYASQGECVTDVML